MWGKKRDTSGLSYQDELQVVSAYLDKSPFIENKWVRKFVSNLLHIIAIIVSFVLIVASLGFAFGAFGFPGNDPLWMIVTIPCGVVIAAGLVAAWTVYLDWLDHR